MRVLFEPKYYTRARCAPLGVLSIGSYLQSKGHKVKVLNRAIASTYIETELDEFRPDFVGCSLLSVMAVEDCLNISKAAKKEISALSGAVPLFHLLQK